MLVATVMHAILDAFFFDLDLDLILFMLCNIIAFIMFGIITLGLAYGFHPELTTYYVTSFVYGSPAPEFVSTVPTPPVVPELAHHSPVLLPHPIQPKRTQTAISEVNRDRFHQPGNRRFVSNLANDPFYTPLRQEPHSLRTTPTPLYPSAAPAPLAMALRHRGPATERFIRQDRINSIAPSLPTPPHAHPINSKPPSPATSPSPAKETGTPHHRPTLTELRESVLASLSLTKTLPLAVDENGPYLPYKLARKSDYWTVVEKETGAIIGIINATGHLGQGISTLGSVHAQATSIGLPIDPIFNTLQAYTFESLPRNPDGSHTKITPSSHAKYLNVYDLDGTHRSVIDQDSRLFKALELFASGDFTTSVEHLAPIPAAITPVENGLLSTVTAHTTTPPAPVTADTGMLGAAPIAAATIADTLPAFVAPIFADTIMTEILILTDIDMAEAAPITAGTEMLYADMDTSASGPLILIDTLMTVSNASGLADPDMAVPAAPSSGDTMMVEVANSPALGAFDMMDVASDSLDDIAMAEATAIDAAAIILEVDVHIDYDDAVMTDTTTDPILPEIDMADVPPATTPIIVTPVVSFSHTGLSAVDKARFQTAMPIPDTSDQFDGPCTVSWKGPSGSLKSGPLTLEIRRFLDEELMVPLNDSVYNFKAAEGTLLGSFTVLKTSPSFRNHDDLPTFPFQFQRVGSQDPVEFDVVMTKVVADEFNLMTGLALPPN